MNPTIPPSDPETNDLRFALESSGRRLTKQRAAVFQQLCDSDHHPTAEDVYRGVKEVVPTISLATVYKALEALVDSGLATKLVGANGSARYDGRGDRHYHLRCLRSGQVQDLPTAYDPDLIVKLDPNLVSSLRQSGFRVTGYRMELVGYFEQAEQVEAKDDLS